MQYDKFTIVEFFSQINSEEKARNLIWRHKFNDNEFICSNCGNIKYYQYQTRPEIRKCTSCKQIIRLRVNTIFEHSKLPLLTWLRAIFLMMSGKRGVSALEIFKQLDIKSYRTAWNMLHKIRHALSERDERYKLKGIIELDSTCFGKEATGNQEEVLIGVESKKWVDEKGEEKANAGFAKVILCEETKENVEEFIKDNFYSGSEVHSDGAKAYTYSDKELNVKTMNTYSDHVLNEKWLPWVHRFISNAKTWVLGTHHGVTGHYLANYLSEFVYRFNRRHDFNGLFSRSLFACSQAEPIRLGVLCG